MIVAAEQLTLGVKEVLVYCGIVAFAAVFIKGFREIWHGEKRHLEPTPGWWLWGDVLWRGFVRAGLPSGGLLIVGSALLAPWPFVLPDDSTAQYVSFIVVLCGAALVLLLGFSTVLFARPKCVIAPPLRHQRGAIAEWLGIGSDEDERDPRRPRFLDSS